MATLILAWKSLLNRRYTVGLTVLAIALAVALLLGVERLRYEARSGFTATISGTDLIVGARSSPVQLLLYSVFRMGEATNNISWRSYRQIADHPRVQWTVPLSLGDSHRGYPVLATNQDYFKYYRYADARPLELSQGEPFSGVFEAVLGNEVARELSYELGREIVIAHGADDVAFVRHDDMPFTVRGILAPTRTAVDRTIHISLEGFEAIHLGWQAGVPLPGRQVSPDEARQRDLTPRQITAFLVGLDSRAASFQLQRYVNDYPREALTAILPGVALHQLWDLLGMAEQALLLVSWFVVGVGLLGMLSAQLSNLEARRREMAILRAVGAGPRYILLLICGEALMLALLGAVLGTALLYALLFFAGPLIEARFGLFIGIGGLRPTELTYLGIVLLAGLFSGLVPAVRAYRQAVVNGINMRL
ncbi:ABC transporter permease [Desulfurivibrio alkaliphilus]|nr:ABC transporter permease [Desulfurivibrio alkaliphilus]MDF1614148.1 ABC transporter permease [Desulfurivibrio alkaliphilus]